MAKVPSEQTLKTTFNQWDKDKLVHYALSLTSAMMDQQKRYDDLIAQYLLTQTALQGLTLVEEIGQHLSSILDLNEVLTLLLRRVNLALDARDGSILLVDEPTGDLVFQISLGAISEEIKPFRVPKGQGIAGEVALTGVPIRVDNAQQDARHFRKIDLDTGFLTQSILCVPLITREKIIGVIEVFNKKSGSFTEEDQHLLASIANYAAIAIENARLHQSVLAEKDRVVKAQEDASRKLQRDLHDGPTQLVAAIEMSVEFCKKALVKDLSLVDPELDNIAKLAHKATNQMRTLLFELRPLVLESQGLVAAIQTFLERRQKDEPTRLHLEITSDLPDQNIPRMEGRIEMALFAIIQEAVTNALKHAKAENIFVKIGKSSSDLTVTILDDGLGFDTKLLNQNYEDRGSYGMVNIKERSELTGGKLTIQSAPGAGAEITITLPLKPPPV